MMGKVEAGSSFSVSLTWTIASSYRLCVIQKVSQGSLKERISADRGRSLFLSFAIASSNRPSPAQKPRIYFIAQASLD